MMLVVVDGDTRGVMCARLRGMGNVVLEPPVYANRGSRGAKGAGASSEFHDCLLAAWYLIVGRRAAAGGGLFVGTVFVRGGPRTVGISAPVRARWRSCQFGTAYARLQRLLATEFRADAYVLFSMDGPARALDGSMLLAEARDLNARYWSTYQWLRASGARTFVI